MRIHAAIDNKYDCPITVSQGRQWLDKLNEDKEAKDIEKIPEKKYQEKEVAVEIRGNS